MTPSVRAKLRTKHDVEESEVEECFYNRTHSYLLDENEEHQTDPPTYYFVSETDTGRKLLVCFMNRGTYLEIKTAFEPTNQDRIEKYYNTAVEE